MPETVVAGTVETKSPTAMQLTRMLLREKGIAGLYKGLGATILRYLLHNPWKPTSLCLGYHSVHSLCSHRKEISQDRHYKNQPAAQTGENNELSSTGANGSR